MLSFQPHISTPSLLEPFQMAIVNRGDASTLFLPSRMAPETKGKGRLHSVFMHLQNIGHCPSSENAMQVEYMCLRCTKRD